MKYAARVEAIDASKSPPKVKFASAATVMPDQPPAPVETNHTEGATAQLSKNASLNSISSIENLKTNTDRKRSKLSTLIQLQNKESQEVEKSAFAAKKI